MALAPPSGSIQSVSPSSQGKGSERTDFQERREFTGKCYGYFEFRHSIYERHPGVSSRCQYVC